MWLSAKYFLCWMLLACLLTGCGYSFSHQAPIDLPQGHTLLCITKVVNPSTESWMEPLLRAELRDEFTRRGQVRWVNRDEAETLVTIRITRYSSKSALKGADDTTVTSAIYLTLSVDMYNAADHAVIWTSGRVDVSQSFKGALNEHKARKKAVRRAVEHIADRLTQVF